MKTKEADKTPLDLAAENKLWVVADLLRAKGATGKPSAHVVFQAVLQNDVPRLRKLLAEDPSLINFQNEAGLEPFSVALVLGKTESGACLLEHGVDPNGKDKYGNPYLVLAAYANGKEIMQLLLDKGANVVATTSDGFTALHMALSKDVAAILLEHKADIEAQPPQSPITPLFAAARFGRMEVVEFLVAHGAKINAVVQNGMTPLDAALTPDQKGNAATKQAKQEIAEYLRAHGAVSGKK